MPQPAPPRDPPGDRAAGTRDDARSLDPRQDGLGRHGSLRSEPIGDPCPRSSLGAIDRWREVSTIDPPGSSARLLFEYSLEDVANVDATSLRVFRIDPSERAFELVEASGVDVAKKVVGAWVDRQGIYGVYGLPRHPRGVEAVRWLANCFPLIAREVGSRDAVLQRRICEFILCADPLDGGMRPVPGGLCELCIGLQIPHLGLPEFQLLERPLEILPISKKKFGPIKRLANGDLACALAGTVVRLQPDGSGMRTIGAVAGRFLKAPVWSPDGRRLAFSTATVAGWEIGIVDEDGSGLATVASGPGDAGAACWRPDGSEILFGTNVSSFQSLWELRAVAPDGSGLHTLGPFSHNAFSPTCSPDGQVAFCGDTSVYFWDQMSAPQSISFPSDVDKVEWARDGRLLLVRWSGSPRRFSVVPTQGGVPTGPAVELPLQGNQFFSLSFSPRGDRLCGTRHLPSGARELVVMDFDRAAALAGGSGAITNVQATLSGDVLYPSWQPVFI